MIDNEAQFDALITEVARRLKAQDGIRRLVSTCATAQDDIDVILVALARLNDMSKDGGDQRVIDALGGLDAAQSLAFILASLTVKADKLCILGNAIANGLLQACHAEREVRKAAQSTPMN